MRIPFFGKSVENRASSKQGQKRPGSEVMRRLAERLILQHANPEAIFSKRPSLLKSPALSARKPFKSVSTVRMKGPVPKFTQTKAGTRMRQ
ncbi:MAG: hypothetical protein WCW44_01165 [archaeon]|jgi:hypothetical protein